jgi:deoxyribonuclease-4
MSIAGGVGKALLRGQEIGCDTIQIFTKNNNQWRAKPLTDSEIRTYREHRDATGIWPVVAHDGYLINIASPKRDLYRKSLEALQTEVGRAAALEIPFLIIHPGAHLGSGEADGIQRIVEALNTICDGTKDSSVMICLETTAGQGSSLGYRFEHLAGIREGIMQRERVGVCVDTCHIFAAGYEIRGRKAYDETMRRLDEVIGLDQIACIHLNDSQRELGSRVDRHAHVGQGHIGLEGFRLLVNDPRFRHVPMILETPKGDDPIASDRHNLAVLRSLVKGRRDDPRAY